MQIKYHNDVSQLIDSAIFENEIGFLNYTVYRYDTDLALSGLSACGGSLITIKSSISAQLLSTYPVAEQIFIKLNLGDISVLLSVAYFSQGSELTVYNSHLYPV